MIIAGADDEVFDAHSYTALLPAIPHGQVTIVPNANHLGVIYHPLTLRAIATWLEGYQFQRQGL
jgi:hypothetical protein